MLTKQPIPPCEPAVDAPSRIYGVYTLYRLMLDVVLTHERAIHGPDFDVNDLLAQLRQQRGEASTNAVAEKQFA